LTDQEIDGQMRKLLTHFDRNGLGYTLDRETGELLVAEKFDPAVNWTTGVDMDPNSANYGRPAVVAQYMLSAAKTPILQSNILVLETAGLLLRLMAAGIWRTIDTEST
ncbi:hypothetical protein M2T59_30415, partial [Klebsiella pneumoniae]|nr:hypothetical protein [Klebsiella pneumoniae]